MVVEEERRRRARSEEMEGGRSLLGPRCSYPPLPGYHDVCIPRFSGVGIPIPAFFSSSHQQLIKQQKAKSILSLTSIVVFLLRIQSE